MYRLKVLVLDAMGVIYSVRDDVGELLYPFILEKGGIKDLKRINTIYDAASIGEIQSNKLWKSVGLVSSMEDDYLKRYQLTYGLIDFLGIVKQRGYKI